MAPRTRVTESEQGRETLRSVETADGSRTLERVESGWTYRSVYGAHTESDHVFVGGTGVATLDADPLRVLELGFGAGSNFEATVLACRRRGAARLEYHGVDRDPPPVDLLMVEDPVVRVLATEACQNGSSRLDGVTLVLERTAFTAVTPVGPFDAVYFDPFGPSQQPESWSVEAFAVAARRLAPMGRLATYAAAGWVRRNMAAAGLFVATAPGPDGKREFTIAARAPGPLAPHRIRNRPGSAP